LNEANAVSEVSSAAGRKTEHRREAARSAAALPKRRRLPAPAFAREVSRAKLGTKRGRAKAKKRSAGSSQGERENQ
jgi:hypothetical protein